MQIQGAVTATLSNVVSVVEKAGLGNNNTLSTAPSLGSIPDTLIGNGGGTITFQPNNKGPSTAIGSSNSSAINFFVSNPNGGDVFTGGAGKNLFDWQPGTGTDTYNGAGKSNTVLVVGNSNGSAEDDTLHATSNGGVVFSRNNLVPFQIYTQDIQNWVLEPSTAAKNDVTIGNLSGTTTKQVEAVVNNSTVGTANQANPNVKLVVDGTQNVVREGAGPTSIINTPAPTALDLLHMLQGS